MHSVKLYTDGSVNSKTKVGVGAYVTACSALEVYTKQFFDTSSTRLELQTLLWALSEIKFRSTSIDIYTDSQNIVRLLGRRKRLEQNNFIAKNGKKLKNYKLYEAFYSLMDEVDCSINKVKGHKSSKSKDENDKLFTLVDRASRNELRKLS